ncbi:helix-turn-helix transcriptional regulator [Paenibacillus rhizovicinus]|uniref:Helix-turn-helix transcriptional regulator n=1 Tax=Paenibacillus rhizovicinus TaxID=2704463 RepID=A0A6C0NUP4_9BACL|nr:helix-turn-helix domain-containing protein [Paenibacillus rhizovicinus]QHW29907.1 helix-turn-helix transcriptional regulator [Paenibacillus rhizovicinus]
MKAETEWIELWQGSEDFKNVPHAHEDWMQVTLPIQGTCHFTQEARSYALEQGSGLIQPPGTNHHFQIGARTSVIILKVRERGIGGMNAIQPRFEAGARQDIRQSFVADDIVSRFRQWMLALIQGQALADPLAVQEVEIDVVRYLGRLTGVTSGVPSPESGWGAAGTAGTALPIGGIDPHLRRALAYMHDCYENAISIDDLAGIALQSRFHFIRTFRETMGTTPYQYLLKLRMDEAMNRLRRSDATVGQISADLGFSSTSQFHRAFLKMTGVTPQAFRLQ